MTQAFVLLAACLVLALLFAVGTVRLATGLLRKMMALSKSLIETRDYATKRDAYYQ